MAASFTQIRDPNDGHQRPARRPAARFGGPEGRGAAENAGSLRSRSTGCVVSVGTADSF